MDKKDIIRVVILILVFAISFSVTYGIKAVVSGNDAVDEDVNYSGSSSVAVVEDDKSSINENDNKAQVAVTDTVAQSEPLELYALNVTVVGPVCDYNTLAYNLTVNISNLPPKAVAHYVIRDRLKGDAVSKSDNGKFKAVPATESGEYNLYISWIDSLGYSGLSVDTVLTGFKPFEKPKIKKFEADELERLINKCDRKLSTRNAKISSALQLVFTNINSDETCPQTIDEIYNKIKFGKWSSVTVTSVDYNDDNQVVQITMQINHSEE